MILNYMEKYWYCTVGIEASVICGFHGHRTHRKPPIERFYIGFHTVLYCSIRSIGDLRWFAAGDRGLPVERFYIGFCTVVYGKNQCIGDLRLPRSPYSP
jgi:hypothetical protein